MRGAGGGGGGLGIGGLEPDSVLVLGCGSEDGLGEVGKVGTWAPGGLWPGWEPTSVFSFLLVPPFYLTLSPGAPVLAGEPTVVVVPFLAGCVDGVWNTQTELLNIWSRSEKAVAPSLVGLRG